MNENPVTVEFQAAAERCRAANKDYRADLMLSALRDAAQGLADSGFHVTLEVRPRLQDSGSSQGGALANAALRVDNTSIDWVIWSEEAYRNNSEGDYRSNYVRTTSLAGFAANREIGRFTAERKVYDEDKSWKDPSFGGGRSLKDALVALVLQVKAEQEVYGEYNFGAQPLTVLAKPQIPAAGLRQKKDEGARPAGGEGP